MRNVLLGLALIAGTAQAADDAMIKYGSEQAYVQKCMACHG